MSGVSGLLPGCRSGTYMWSGVLLFFISSFAFECEWYKVKSAWRISSFCSGGVAYLFPTNRPPNNSYMLWRKSITIWRLWTTTETSQNSNGLWAFVEGSHTGWTAHVYGAHHCTHVSEHDWNSGVNHNLIDLRSWRMMLRIVRTAENWSGISCKREQQSEDFHIWI